jgi:RecJ-like exonuclease
MELLKNKGEYVCYECNGEGNFIINEVYTEICWVCKGTGKIDWIDNIIHPESLSYCFAHYSTSGDSYCSSYYNEEKK